MSAEQVLGFLLVLLVILISIDVHEFSHAWAATWLGDPTPELQGRLTLNPAAHLDPLGTLMIVISSFSGFGFGWGRPVQVNAARLRYGPAVGMGIVAAAGPLSNLLIALITSLGYRLLGCSLVFNRGAMCDMFTTFVFINVVLALFNLIPLFPLDGFRIVLAILRLFRGRTAIELGYRLESTAAYGPMLFILLIMADQVLHVSILATIIGTPASALIRFLLGFRL
ncbi:MAG: site-2 protease family protein [Chloroflexi bacterium]|nr:site-2 protease family protein [Chloroflexota bacterium]